MKILVLAALAVAVAADVSSLNLHYAFPGSSYDVPQNSVTGSAKYFEVSPTSPSPLLHVPIHEAQDFNAQITNVGVSGYSTPSSLLDYSFTTPAPSLAVQQNFVSTTPAPNVEISSFSTPSSIIDGGFSQTTAAPSLALNSGFQRYQFPSSYNFGLNAYSTAAPALSAYSTVAPVFGSSQLASIDSSLFNRDAAINSVHVATSAGSIDDSFGISTPSSISAEIYQDEPPQPQVNRHLYFFAAPEEPEPIRPRIKIASQPQKNVRVIFVKAPSPPAIAPVQITAPQQNEEKTVVYVLVKKPEEHQDIRVDQAPTPAPSKPEVFFIKYQNQQEAEEAVRNIQAGNPHPQYSASNVDGDNSFVTKLNKQIYTKPEPIVKYVRPANQVQNQVSNFEFSTAAPSLGLQQSSFNSFPVFNSRIAYTTPPTVQYTTSSPLQFTTSAPYQYNSGLSFTTAAPSVNSVNFDSGFNGLNLASSQIVDNADVNQNIIESSTVAPQKIEIENKINAESFISSTPAPQVVSGNVGPSNFGSESSFSQNVALPERTYGVYQTSSPAPFRAYGAPNYKK